MNEFYLDKYTRTMITVSANVNTSEDSASGKRVKTTRMFKLIFMTSRMKKWKGPLLTYVVNSITLYHYRFH